MSSELPPPSRAFEVDQVIIRVLKLPLREPFRTSQWVTPHKTPLIVEVRGGGISGWGEGAVPLFPFYNHESPHTALHILRDFALPIFWESAPRTPQELARALARIQRNGFAKAALEMAYWDWCAKAQGVPLATLLGGVRRTIPVGVSVGIQSSLAALLDRVAEFQALGYQRVKLKISPGNDLKPIEGVLTRFPNLPLMVDANSAYTLEGAQVFQSMDRWPLLMIEQPLHETDLYKHSLLQKTLRNPICLDESIESVRDAEAALALQACRIVNIKAGRVGGLTEAVAIHDLCQTAGIPVWCGGMLESGIGRGANMALATLPNFRFPGDISESKRYYHEDVVEPEISLLPGGVLELPQRPGIGFEVNLAAVTRLTTHQEVHTRS